ncbi:MAG: 2Fe-2S iron-sulfur cluster binding domain-containing protein, partial [Spirochaetaceae bacterium]|nr:2Fe-2S iron-sulfur cluster binding domain-containing protein [Spirochaetaceae bacterium]
KDNAYVITIKTGSDAFIPEVITDTWKIGTAISASDPCGQFYYDSLRDSSHLVCIAGGSGITPFRSMISDVLSKHENLSVVMIQGAENAEELLFSNYFLNLEKSDSQRFKWIPVLSGENDSAEKIDHQILRGFINADILSKALGNRENSVFICGPEAMHQHVDAEIEKAKLKPKRIRREDYGIPGHPEGKKPVELTVKMAGIMYQIPADRDETVLVALERAGLNPPSRCRTGSCGWCRGSLLDGKIRYDREPDGLRSADRKGGYFHPCAAKPESNLIIDIPGKPELKK